MNEIIASRSHWRTTALPAARAQISFARSYTAEEFRQIRKGLLPQQMEDHWFAYYEEPWLYFHRSWTGFCIYQLRFETSHDGARVSEVLVNRDPKEKFGISDRDSTLLLAVILDDLAGRRDRVAFDAYVRHARRRWWQFWRWFAA